MQARWYRYLWSKEGQRASVLEGCKLAEVSAPTPAEVAHVAPKRPRDALPKKPNTTPVFYARNFSEVQNNLRQPKSRWEGGGRTWTPMMASIGTSVRGIDTAPGGRKIGCSIPKLHSSGSSARHPAWHYMEH